VQNTGAIPQLRLTDHIDAKYAMAEHVFTPLCAIQDGTLLVGERHYRRQLDHLLFDSEFVADFGEGSVRFFYEDRQFVCEVKTQNEKRRLTCDAGAGRALLQLSMWKEVDLMRMRLEFARGFVNPVRRRSQPPRRHKLHALNMSRRPTPRCARPPTDQSCGQLSSPASSAAW
jgi:hypothetical protein